ncbi:hypothetical protein EON64_18570, partial [archaeon]
TPSAPKIVYATPEEARGAFFSLLSDFSVSALMKIREVQEKCGHDPRWSALDSQGERKQALAEFQVGMENDVWCRMCGVGCMMYGVWTALRRVYPVCLLCTHAHILYMLHDLLDG